jgi:hypothetical protein
MAFKKSISYWPPYCNILLYNSYGLNLQGWTGIIANLFRAAIWKRNEETLVKYQAWRLQGTLIK